ncbi:hypothetical protein FNF27_06478 [Cafeteria roenbergensis]|uniref:Protein disulfide-isomerase n=2 Tax=Cafeteria roenbergensis TaxID=33653 RepID=A0A5A8E3X1_CAFRO|nr:hypothetical protein FNF27_06478 [Cafeteria roenbergensis]
MRATLAVLAFAAIAVLARAEIEEEDDVLVLTSDNFQEALDQYDPLLVEFYAPWCGHCKRLAPEYAKAASELLSNDPPLRIAKVDATISNELATKFGVQGFPTMKFFRGGQPQEYGGGRTASEIVDWVKRKSGPAFKHVADAAEATEFKGSSSVTVFGFFAAAEGTNFEAFASAAAASDDVSFAVVTDADVRTALGVTGTDDTVVLFKDFDEGQADFEGDLSSASDISDFVGTHRLPLVTTFTSEVAPAIFGGPIKVHVLIMADGEMEDFEALKANWAESAKEFRGKALFIWVPPSEERILSYFDVTEADLPTAVVVTMPEGAAMQKFPFSGSLAGPALGEFTGSVLKGDVKPTLKSEEPDASDLEGPVVVVKGKSFRDIVYEEGKDVLVEFYAPWCGHCKSLAPIYEELATNFASNDKVVIAKMDATANEIDEEGVTVRGFPTLYFFPAAAKGEKKVPMEFSGARDLDGLTKFIKTNAVSESAKADSKDEL